MTKPKGEFQRDKFLLLMLASIFSVQAGVFIFGVTKCLSLKGALQNCPEIGRRYDQTFGVMVATTLALLTGAQMKKGSSSRSYSDDRDDASVSQLPPQVQQSLPKKPPAPDLSSSSQEASSSPQAPQPSSGKKNRQS